MIACSSDTRSSPKCNVKPINEIIEFLRQSLSCTLFILRILFLMWKQVMKTQGKNDRFLTQIPLDQKIETSLIVKETKVKHLIRPRIPFLGRSLLHNKCGNGHLPRWVRLQCTVHKGSVRGDSYRRVRHLRVKGRQTCGPWRKQKKPSATIVFCLCWTSILAFN